MILLLLLLLATPVSAATVKYWVSPLACTVAPEGFTWTLTCANGYLLKNYQPCGPLAARRLTTTEAKVLAIPSPAFACS